MYPDQTTWIVATKESVAPKFTTMLASLMVHLLGLSMEDHLAARNMAQTVLSQSTNMVVVTDSTNIMLEFLPVIFWSHYKDAMRARSGRKIWKTFCARTHSSREIAWWTGFASTTYASSMKIQTSQRNGTTTPSLGQGSSCAVGSTNELWGKARSPGNLIFVKDLQSHFRFCCDIFIMHYYLRN